MAKLEKTIDGVTSELYTPKMIGDLVWENRTKKRMTQKELAEVIHATQADISNIEKAKVNINLQTAVRLAEGLGMQLKISLVQDKSQKQKKA